MGYILNPLLTILWTNTYSYEFLVKLEQASPLVHKDKAQKKGQSMTEVITAYSEDEDGSVNSSTNVSSVGLHVLPPSPISFAGSLSSNEGN